MKRVLNFGKWEKSFESVRNDRPARAAVASLTRDFGPVCLAQLLDFSNKKVFLTYVLIRNINANHFPTLLALLTCCAFTQRLIRKIYLNVFSVKLGIKIFLLVEKSNICLG